MKQEEWISEECARPEHNVSVLVYTEDEEFEITSFNHDKNKWSIPTSVMYWMDLPEPPETGQ